MCATLAVAGVLGLTTVARAQPVSRPPAPVLDWSAPADCPTSAAVERDIEQILGGPARPDPPLRARVQVGQREDGTWWAALVTVQGGTEGERELSGVDCSEVAHAVALVLALMVAPTQNAAPEPAAAPSPEPTVAPAPAEPRSRPAPAPRGPWLLLRAGVSLGTGTLPDLDAGGAVHLGVASRWWSAEVRAAVWLPQTASLDAESGMGADLWMVAATPVACFRGPLGSVVRLDTCGGLGVTQMHASGFGMSDPASVTARWGTVRAEQAVALSLSDRVAVRPGFQVAWPLSRPHFAIRNVGQVHRPEKTAVSGVLAVEFGF